MSDTITMKVNARALKGRGGAREVRRADQAPAIIYGAGKDIELVSVDQNLINRLVHQVAFHTQVLELTLPSGKIEHVIVKEVQYHPIKPMVRHIDFFRVSMKKVMQLAVPIHCLGEDECLAIREEGGVVMQHKHEIEVECLPADLPSRIELNVSALAMDQTLHVSDITLPKGVVFVDLPHDDHNHPVVSIHASKMMAEEAPEPVLEEGGEAAASTDAGAAPEASVKADQKKG